MKNLIRPLILAGGGVFLTSIVLLDIFDDSTQPEYDQVMQVLPGDGSVTAKDMSDNATVEILAPEAALVESRAELSGPDLESTNAQKKLQRQIGYAEVEYALRLVKLDSFGQLILNANAEASLNRAVARLPVDLSQKQILHIKELIQNSLPGAAGVQVADVFTKYYSYKITEKAFIKNSLRPNDVDSALEQLATMTDLRYEMMGDEYAEKLFGEQQRRAEYHLGSEIIKRDTTMSAEEKKQQLSQLKVAAQEKGLTFSSPSPEVEQLNTEIAKMRADGQDEALIQDRREQVLGEGAAEQLSLMEAQQHEWQLRYEKFSQQKSLLLASALDADELASQLDYLFSLHYSAEELSGARAYDQKFSR